MYGLRNVRKLHGLYHSGGGMIVCGISVAASEATLLWIDSATRLPIDGAAAKVSLSDPYSKQDLLQTAEVLRQLLAERRTELVAIKKASTSGKFPAGHVSYRIETLISLIAQCDVCFVAPQGIAAFVKRVSPGVPESLRKYQHEAYLTTLAALEIE